MLSAGDWVRQRREALGLTRKALAELIACSPDTIKKVEGELRRPSHQIATLLAQHLHIPTAHKETFIRFVRGSFVPSFLAPQDDLPGAQSTPDRFKVLSRLDPLPEQELFGVAQRQQQIISKLETVERPFLISIEGLGGLGKTSLAHTTVHHFLNSNRFADIAWVSAKQEAYITGRGIQPTQKPALTTDTLIDLLLIQLADGPYPVGDPNARRLFLLRLLKQKPCLIVVDNLETAVDTHTLLPLLRTLANPSKFLITSRLSLQAESDVACLSLSELTEADALAFLRYEAKAQHVQPLLNGGEAALRHIYQAVGGNPLALKLIIGQAHFLPLGTILANLQRQRASAPNEFYAYVYWQSWQMLEANGRTLLLNLPLVPNGTFAQLQTASQLPLQPLQQALASLRQLSLVEVGGDLHQPRYRLHRLTETFVMNELLHWQQRPFASVEVPEETAVFQQSIQTMLTHWHENTAVKTVDVNTLDAEREGILKAIQLGLHLPTAWPAIRELVFALTPYMERRGHWQLWQKTLAEALAMARQQEDVAGEVRVLGVYGRILQRQNKISEVVATYRRMIRLARQTGNEIETARACSNLGFALIARKQWWRAEQLCCHALAIFNAHAYPHGQAHTHNHLGILFHKQQQWAAAKTHLQTACQIWQANEDWYGLLYGLQNLGYLHNDMNEPEEALHYLQNAENYSKQVGEQGERPNIYLNMAVAHQKAGAATQAEQLARQAEAVYQQQGNLRGVCLAWEHLATIYQQQNNPAKADQYRQAAEDGLKNLITV